MSYKRTKVEALIMESSPGQIFFFFWPYCTAYGILVPQTGIKPGPQAVKAQNFNHWTAREFSPTLQDRF